MTLVLDRAAGVRSVVPSPCDCSRSGVAAPDSLLYLPMFAKDTEVYLCLAGLRAPVGDMAPDSTPPPKRNDSMSLSTKVLLPAPKSNAIGVPIRLGDSVDARPATDNVSRVIEV